MHDLRTAVYLKANKNSQNIHIMLIFKTLKLLLELEDKEITGLLLRGKP
jgi:hypothetical protein